MSTPTTQVNTRGGKGTTNPPTDTAKQNYTAQTIGKNEKGSVWIGPIHKQGDVTSAVVLRNEQDRTHQLCLDIDGERPGSTTSTDRRSPLTPMFARRTASLIGVPQLPTLSFGGSV